MRDGRFIFQLWNERSSRRSPVTGGFIYVPRRDSMVNPSELIYEALRDTISAC